METESIEVWDEGQKRDGRGRQIFNQAERDRLIDRYQESGLTQRAFAEREGINYTTFVGWLSRRRHEGSRKNARKAEGSAFTEVMLSGPRVDSIGRWEVEVVLPDRTLVRGQSAREAAALVKLLLD